MIVFKIWHCFWLAGHIWMYLGFQGRVHLLVGRRMVLFQVSFITIPPHRAWMPLNPHEWQPKISQDESEQSYCRWSWPCFSQKQIFARHSAKKRKHFSLRTGLTINLNQISSKLSVSQYNKTDLSSTKKQSPTVIAKWKGPWQFARYNRGSLQPVRKKAISIKI